MDNAGKAVFFEPFNVGPQMTHLRQPQGSRFGIWCVIQRSAHRSTHDLITKLKQYGTILTQGSLHLINDIKLRSLVRVKNYRLVKITVEELDLPDKSTWGEIHQRADSKGLLLCPSWVGYDLCIQKKGMIEPDEQYFIGIFEGIPSQKDYFFL